MDRHIKQSLDDLEQARQHFGCSEVLLDFLLAESVARFLEFFAHVGPVPGLWIRQVKMLGCKLTQVSQVLFSKRTGFAGQIA